MYKSWKCGNTFGVKKIGVEAFIDCSALKSIEIPSSLEIIERDAFNGCENLEEIQFQGTKKQWSAIKKQTTWRDETPLKVVHCSDGDVNIKPKQEN